MKYLKPFNESKTDIHSICKKWGIENYTINPDGSIDVDDNVDLYSQRLTKLPLKFRNVSGDFNCSNNKLISLEGCPQSVSADFICFNNQLTSLEGGPQSVGGGFYCYNNQLISLVGCPQSLSGSFNCKNNKLTSLKGCPQSVGGYFYCSDNKLTSLEGFPEYSESDIIYLNGNPIFEIYNLFGTFKCIKWLNEFDVIQGNKVILDRLEEVFHQLNMTMPENITFKSYEII
jgi:hypothetical protein